MRNNLEYNRDEKLSRDGHYLSYGFNEL